MNLYILRHGEAESQAESDSSRALTKQGRIDVLNVAQQFSNKNLPLDICYVSSYKRAQQTAELFVSELSIGLPLNVTDRLIPEVRAIEVMKFLSKVKNDSVLLVSHNPLLSELLALLTQGDTSSLKIVSTAELYALTLEEVGHGQGELQFCLSPFNNV